MGSSRSEYYRSTVTWDDLRYVAEEMAWKKTGFEDREALKEHVRSLPLEERLDLLTEHLIDDIAKIYLQRRMDFIEGLGQTTCVTREELLEYAARVYPNYEVDTAWIEMRHYISPKDFSLVSCRRKR